MNNQTDKKDNGKLPLTQVPSEIIYNIAAVRQFGMKKYSKEPTWKNVEVERYRDAMYRHWLAYVEDPYGLDEESGLPHLYHVAWNCATLCELEKGKFKDNKLDLSKIKKPVLRTEDVEDALIWYGDVIKPDVVPFAQSKVDSDNFDWDKCDYIVYEKDMEKKK